MSVNWSSLYADRLAGMTTSAIRDILKVAQAEGVISMAGGWPEADLFPVEQLAEVSDYVMRNMTRESLQYGLTDGLPALRQIVAEEMVARGVPASIDNIIITSGSQQALDLIARIMLNPGDTVLVESPTFLGALQSFKGCQCEFVGVPMDEDGVLVDRIPALIERSRPKFMYLIPTFQNPTGVTMSLARRQKLIQIAAEMGVPIVEDDPYGKLRFSGQEVATLASLDAAQYPQNAARGSYVQGNVIYLSTFSKTLAPGLRVAWVAAPPEIAQQFVMVKQGADLQTNALSQAIAYEFVRRGWLPAQVERIRQTYAERRQAMFQAIDDYFPQGVECTNPDGGLFLWVTLPEGMNAVDLLKDAAAHKVAFVPGAPFFVDGRGQNTLRLTFASVPPETIRLGIQRLGEVIGAHMA